MTITNTSDVCPKVVANEADDLWKACVQTLRTDGFLRTTVVLFHDDPSTSLLTPARVILPEEMTSDIGVRERFAQSIRREVSATGATVVLTAMDTWNSPTFPTTGVRPRFATDRQEILMLTVELRDGGAWIAQQIYTRIGQTVFIADQMQLQSASIQGRFGNWWTPTPVPKNN